MYIMLFQIALFLVQNLFQNLVQRKPLPVAY
jgi:hypothetical protein